MGKGKSGGKVKGGEYLHISVYGKRGFDVEAIRQKCKDIEEHEVLGKTYKVCIRSTFSKTIEQLVRKEVGETPRIAPSEGQAVPAMRLG